jgi:hypothetical protein
MRFTWPLLFVLALLSAVPAGAQAPAPSVTAEVAGVAPPTAPIVIDGATLSRLPGDRVPRSQWFESPATKDGV